MESRLSLFLALTPFAALVASLAYNYGYFSELPAGISFLEYFDTTDYIQSALLALIPISFGLALIGFAAWPSAKHGSYVGIALSIILTQTCLYIFSGIEITLGIFVLMLVNAGMALLTIYAIRNSKPLLIFFAILIGITIAAYHHGKEAGMTKFYLSDGDVQTVVIGKDKISLKIIRSLNKGLIAQDNRKTMFIPWGSINSISTEYEITADESEK